jgi:hypothetical protein
LRQRAGAQETASRRGHAENSERACGKRRAGVAVEMLAGMGMRETASAQRKCERACGEHSGNASRRGHAGNIEHAAEIE